MWHLFAVLAGKKWLKIEGVHLKPSCFFTHLFASHSGKRQVTPSLAARVPQKALAAESKSMFSERQ